LKDFSEKGDLSVSFCCLKLFQLTYYCNQFSPKGNQSRVVTAENGTTKKTYASYAFPGKKIVAPLGRGELKSKLTSSENQSIPRLCKFLLCSFPGLHPPENPQSSTWKWTIAQTEG